LKILLALFNSDQAQTLKSALESLSHQVTCVGSVKEADQYLRKESPDVGFADLKNSPSSFLAFLKETSRDSSNKKLARWILQIPEHLSPHPESLWTSAIITSVPEISENLALSLLQKLEAWNKDPFQEIIETLEAITGVQLAKEKRTLAESRLRRRLYALNLINWEEYSRYFHLHRSREIPEAISLVTTHTTEFFREEQHFDYLFENIYPKLCAGQKQICIWSAACSTGQEVYSLAISMLEFLASLGLPSEQRPQLQIIGTDIDDACLEIASNGIYRQELLAPLSAELVHKYFDVGTGELEGFVRIKDHVHALCRFERVNLLRDEFSLPAADVVFLRNTMIYFTSEDVTTIVSKIHSVLKPQGHLFLGHSESLSGLRTSYEGLGSSIYHKADSNSASTAVVEPFQKKIQYLGDLILIGASTGGVEALRVVLEKIPLPSPPIVIVQHIPGAFSSALAKRLNETCPIAVSEALDGESLENSRAYIAPGGKQMKIHSSRGKLRIEINDDPPMGLHKPSVDYLFQSAVPLLKNINVAAALLTGMGRDGAAGLKSLRLAGAHTIAQNEETSVVFGMPGAAVSIDAAKEVLPLTEIADRLLWVLKKKNAA